MQRALVNLKLGRPNTKAAEANKTPIKVRITIKRSITVPLVYNNNCFILFV